MKREDVPERYRPMYDRALAGRSRKAAIRAHCLMCVGWDASEVRRCSAPACPLFPYRVGPSKEGVDEQEDDETTSVDRLAPATI